MSHSRSISEYFSNKKTPYGFNFFIARWLDEVGRFLSFEEVEGESSWVEISGKVLVCASFGTLGIFGGLCRFLASTLNIKDAKINTPSTDPTKIKQAAVGSFAIRSYTLNAALMTRLPYASKSFINGSFLDANSERAEEIANDIIRINPGIVHLQEVFDANAEKIFKSKLKEKFPYSIYEVGDTGLTVGSGLLFFSQYPIVDYQFVRYDHSMLGEESLATKGALLVVLQVGDKRVLTIGTHTQSGGALIKSISEPMGGTTGDRRDKQLGQLNRAIEEMEERNNVDITMLSGDLNHRSENLAKQHSVSQGQRHQKGKPKSSHLHEPAPQLGQIKHPHINQLMDRFNVIDPDLKTLDPTPRSELDGELEKKSNGYMELKYTRGPLNYREVKVGGKEKIKQDKKQELSFDAEIRERQRAIKKEKLSYAGANDVPIYTGTAVEDYSQPSGGNDQKQAHPGLADQGKLIDVTLVSDTKKFKKQRKEDEKKRRDTQARFKLFQPSDIYYQRTVIHSVKGKSDHHALVTEVTDASEAKSSQERMIALALEEPGARVCEEQEVKAAKEKQQQPRSMLQRLGY